MPKRHTHYCSVCLFPPEQRFTVSFLCVDRSCVFLWWRRRAKTTGLSVSSRNETDLPTHTSPPAPHTPPAHPHPCPSKPSKAFVGDFSSAIPMLFGTRILFVLTTTYVSTCRSIPMHVSSMQEKGASEWFQCKRPSNTNLRATYSIVKRTGSQASEISSSPL